MIRVIEPVEPAIILGIEAFEECIRQSESLGKWEAWKQFYFEPFKGAFQPMLDVVYQDKLDALQPHVEAMDFNADLANARAFIESNGEDCVRKALRRAMSALPMDKSFPVYLIVGLGHANGMALPAREPYMFIGLEMAKCQASIDGLVAHEYNHLYRVQRFYRDVDYSSYKVSNLTVGEFTITEGLATVFPLVLSEVEATPQRIAECLPALGDPAEAVMREATMRSDVLAHWDEPADREMIVRFVSSGVSYFVGALMIARLLEAGYDICGLTRMSTEKLSEIVCLD
ncbi:hypothetical protein KAH43_06070 [Candidatus Bipolaricaulota bacterium]|nr:hypothetical protein [Candidatus Bipolaricaulota bacterium]